MQGRIQGRPCASKGGQHTVCLDSKQHFMYGYTLGDNFFACKKPFTQQGPAEVKQLVDDMMPLIIGKEKTTTDCCCQSFN